MGGKLFPRRRVVARGTVPRGRRCKPLPTSPVTIEHRAAFGLLCARVSTLLDFADARCGVARL